MAICTWFLLKPYMQTVAQDLFNRLNLFLAVVVQFYQWCLIANLAVQLQCINSKPAVTHHLWHAKYVHLFSSFANFRIIVL